MNLKRRNDEHKNSGINAKVGNALVDKKNCQCRGEPDALRTHPRRTDMAVRLSGPKAIPLTGWTLRGGWNDSYRMPWHRHMGTAHETLASRRDSPYNPARNLKIRMDSHGGPGEPEIMSNNNP